MSIPRANSTMPSRNSVVGLFLFGSGFCALIYQTTWLREFRLIFGASTAASAAVLGIFMAGLGFGGIVLGQRSETKARPFEFYAKLELLIAATAALSPFLITAARHLYISLGGTETMGVLPGTIARLILAAIILGVPTFLMGGTLPAAARAVVAPDDTSRRAVGVLYGVNTLGAVTGAVSGTFYLFETFGNHATLWSAAILNGVIALIAFHFAKKMPPFGKTAKAARALDKKESEAAANPMFVFVAAGLVGFAFFLMEIVWYRMLAPLLGGSTFSFGLILAVALLGIGLGGLAYALFGLKRSASLQFFALTCAAEAFFVALPFALGDRIAMTAMILRPLGSIGFSGHVFAWTTLCLIVVFPAAFVSGVQFPLLVALLGKGRNEVGRQTGAAYAWNTTGALIGSLAGGFGLIPVFSAIGVWKIVIVLLCALAGIAACLTLRETWHWLRTSVPLATVALALSMLATAGPTAFWRHSQIGVGRLQQFKDSRNEMRDLQQTTRRHIMWEKDGVESSVALSKADSLAFLVNGRSDGNAKLDAGTQIMSGLIAAVLHPRPKKALVIGLGTGSTGGWLAAVPTMESVDVVELEPAIRTVAEKCAPVNHDALRNPKLHITFGDAREVLLTSRGKYDLVVSEPSNPYRAGIANLFTREYYQSIEQRLNPGGLFLQWVQAYEVDDRTIQIFYRTLGSVFPNIESWQTEYGDLLLLASREPVSYDATRLRSRLDEEPFKSGVAAAWHASGLEEFLAHYLGNATVAATLQHLQVGPLNTDDRTVIEFALARSSSLTIGFRIEKLLAASANAHQDRPQFIEGEVDWALVQEARISIHPLLNLSQDLYAPLSAEQKARAASFTSYSAGDPAAALRSWRTQPAEPKTIAQLGLVAEGLAAEGNDAAIGYIEKLAKTFPLEAEAIRAELYLARGKNSDAADILEGFLRALHDNPWPANDLVKRILGLVEIVATADRSTVATRFLYDAMLEPFAVWMAEPERLNRLLKIGLYLDGDRAGQNALAAIKACEPYPMWQRKFLELRKDCYSSTRNGRARQAARDLDEFMKGEASILDIATLTKDIESRSAAPRSDAEAVTRSR